MLSTSNCYGDLKRCAYKTKLPNVDSRARVFKMEIKHARKHASLNDFKMKIDNYVN